MTTDAPRLIGMIGGMSWESSAEYYRLANELVREELGVLLGWRHGGWEQGIAILKGATAHPRGQSRR
jgi:hypothetical protein